jgi:hypothetical protein
MNTTTMKRTHNGIPYSYSSRIIGHQSADGPTQVDIIETKKTTKSGVWETRVVINGLAGYTVDVYKDGEKIDRCYFYNKKEYNELSGVWRSVLSMAVSGPFYEFIDAICDKENNVGDDYDLW